MIVPPRPVIVRQAFSPDQLQRVRSRTVHTGTTQFDQFISYARGQHCRSRNPRSRYISKLNHFVKIFRAPNLAESILDT
ncbi:hypothetical protein BHE74_00008200 [Ensete ventricosum]|nr:hypothetical protein BHE74_00008200 [Ensete ventricosum]